LYFQRLLSIQGKFPERTECFVSESNVDDQVREDVN